MVASFPNYRDGSDSSLHGLCSSWSLVPPSYTMEQVPTKVSSRTSNADAFVFTPRLEAMAKLIKLLIDGGLPVLLDGKAGSGKTSFLQEITRSITKSGETELLHMYIDQQSTASTVWSQLQSRLVWHSGNNYSPEGCKRLLCHVDDLQVWQPRASLFLLLFHPSLFSLISIYV